MKISVTGKAARNLQPKVKDFKGHEEVNWAQQKLHGHNVIVVIERKKVRRALSRTKDYWEKLNGMVVGRMIRSLPAHTVLFGELCIPKGGVATDVPRAMKRQDSKLKFCPFAIPVLEGKDLRGIDLEEAMDKIRGLGFKPPETHEISMYEENLLEFYLECAVELKIEGYVLKKEHCNGWYRVKPVRTVDLVVTGYKWGNGNFAGLVGAMLCSVYNDKGKLEEVASISGMDLDTREKITELVDEDKLEGHVVEVKFQEVGSQGRLSHPRFLRFRDDKPERECVLEGLWA